MWDVLAKLSPAQYKAATNLDVCAKSSSSGSKTVLTFWEPETPLNAAVASFNYLSII